MVELIENRALELEDKTLKFMEQTLKVCDKYDWWKVSFYTLTVKIVLKGMIINILVSKFP